jgi:hypothetical protein
MPHHVVLSPEARQFLVELRDETLRNRLLGALEFDLRPTPHKENPHIERAVNRPEWLLLTVRHPEVRAVVERLQLPPEEPEEPLPADYIVRYRALDESERNELPQSPGYYVGRIYLRTTVTQALPDGLQGL